MANIMNILNIGDEATYLIISASLVIGMIVLSIIFAIKAKKIMNYCQKSLRDIMLSKNLVHFAGIRLLKIMSKGESRAMFFSQKEKVSIMIIKKENQSKWFNSLLSEPEKDSIDWLKEKGFIAFNKKTNSRFEIVLTKKGRRKIKMEVFKERMFEGRTPEEFGAVYIHPFKFMNSLCARESLFAPKGAVKKLKQFALL